MNLEQMFMKGLLGKSEKKLLKFLNSIKLEEHEATSMAMIMNMRHGIKIIIGTINKDETMGRVIKEIDLSELIGGIKHIKDKQLEEHLDDGDDTDNKSN